MLQGRLTAAIAFVFLIVRRWIHRWFVLIRNIHVGSSDRGSSRGRIHSAAANELLQRTKPTWAFLHFDKRPVFSMWPDTRISCHAVVQVRRCFIVPDGNGMNTCYNGRIKWRCLTVIVSKRSTATRRQFAANTKCTGSAWRLAQRFHSSQCWTVWLIKYVALFGLQRSRLCRSNHEVLPSLACCSNIWLKQFITILLIFCLSFVPI